MTLPDEPSAKYWINSKGHRGLAAQHIDMVVNGDLVLTPAETVTGGTPTPADSGPELRGPSAGIGPKYSNAPQKNPSFTGRDDVLTELHTTLAEGTTALVAAAPQTLQGLGGVGKTQLAAEYANRYRAYYDLIWWIDAEQTELITSALAQLAERILLPVGGDVEKAAEAAQDALRRGVPTTRWLLIFDNADAPADVRRFFIDGPGHTLITSRNPNWSGLAQVLPVDVFDRSESIEHLCNRVPGLSEEDAARVAREVGDLPLAVEVAAAWLATTGIPVDTYLTQLKAAAPRALAAGEPPLDYPAPVGQTWNVSIARLREQSPAAVRLLELLAFFGPEPISLRHFFYSESMRLALEPYDRELAEGFMLGKVLRAVSRYGLARVDTANDSVQVHRLVQAVVRSGMSEDEKSTAAHEVHRILIGARPVTGDADDPANWPAFEEIWPHLSPSRAHNCDEPDTRELMIDRVRYLWRRGEFQQARHTGDLLEEAWTAKLGDDDPQILLLRFQLANVMRTQGQYALAQQLDQDTLERQKRVLGEHHPYTLRTASSLAADLRTVGDFHQALALDRETLQRLREQLGEDNPRTLSCANNLAIDYRLTGDALAAQELDQDTLDRRALVLGPKHPYTLSSKSNLARDLRAAGDYEASVTIHQEVVEALAEVLDINAPEILRNATSLAVSLRKAGRQTEARRIITETYERYRERYGENAPDTLACALDLAADYSAGGDKNAARDLARQVHVGHQQLFGFEHPFTLACANNLVIYLRGSGEVEEAVELGRRTVGTLQRVLGPDHPYDLNAKINLANAYADLGEYTRAEQLELAAHRGLTERFNGHHPDAVSCQSNLAVTLRALGRTAQAAELRARALTEFIRQLGEEHPNTVSARGWNRINRDLESQPF
ncbi:tetratricopeptide (TPR) repeat protein [Kitasatospora sp. GAS204A]|uniref:FxSxx-COOH system tetratricopeptide repeat protein n=1 Tax=unclassified Kitasatospora TaxID=2633591 RepID=UPI0024739E41|nr:FxSxx-COOH system tetratricopeptide repeat protein [Kitasatospora sp. GAS204B]MDH6119333.1 tetratricopeptide (TPR) repeat protein [Kitasatospora sp. GAS204B]